MSKGDIGDYMSTHRTEANINELKTYFNSVIDWVSTVFIDVESEMRGLEWGRLYEEHHSKAFNPKKVSTQVQQLYGDPLEGHGPISYIAEALRPRPAMIR